MIWVTIALAGPAAEHAAALDEARTACAAQDRERCLDAYELAHRKALEGVLQSDFGKTKFPMAMGDWEAGTMRTEWIEIPAGSEIPRETAEEAALALDRLDDAQAAVAWARKADVSFAAMPRTEHAGLTGGVGAVVMKLEAQARADGRTATAEVYAALLNDRKQAQEAEWAVQRAQRDASRRWWAGGTLIAFLLCAIPLLRIGVPAWIERLTAKPHEVGDMAPITSVRVLAGARDDPDAWRSTWADTLGRAMLSGMLLAMGPGGFVGVWFFLPLAWKETDAGDHFSNGMLWFLVWLFAAFGVFMLVMWPASPPGFVHRTVRMDADALWIASRVGLKTYEDVVPWADVGDVWLQVHEQHVQHATIISYLVVMRSNLDGRSIVLGGAGNSDRAHELAAAVVRRREANR